MRQIILIVHNVRSSHNVGSLLRTADGLGLKQVYLTGYTPYPSHISDSRLPHLANKIDRAIAKTALGAEKSQAWTYFEDIFGLLAELRQSGWTLAALEQNKAAIELPTYSPAPKLAIIVGREVDGIEPEILSAVDICLEIPMKGKKESFNVAAAAAMALFHCTFSS